MNNIKALTLKLIHGLELILAVVVPFAVIVALTGSFVAFFGADWGDNEVFYQFIYRVLLLVIGLELARLLVTHNLEAVIELIGFVIARKTLKPDITALEVLFIVTSLLLLMVSRHILIHGFQLHTKKNT